jgi:15-cis-phytoene synthase/lycopene beta-cyclase
LTALYFPLFTKLDLYKLVFLITIAVVSTIPWDSYLIRTGVWTYPPQVIIGPTLYDIPYEEVFFFVIQTFNTTLLYLILSKPVLKEIYLVREARSAGLRQAWGIVQVGGQMLLGLGIRQGIVFIQEAGTRTYLGLILVWALPFLLLLWSLAYQFIVGLPLTTTLLPIALPTLYLWIVDTLALKRGTWVISEGTKTGISLWPHLEIEEAIFFLLTNCLIVFGLVAFDNAIAVLNAFPAHFPQVPSLPSPALLVRALLLPTSAYDEERLQGINQAVNRLAKKSRSFYMASSTFSGRLRIDLILLYSFCRVADDLIDTAESSADAREWLAKLYEFLRLRYAGNLVDAKGNVITADDPNNSPAARFVSQNFPSQVELALLLLPTSKLDREPLKELLEGFDMDLVFTEDVPPVTKSTKSTKSNGKTKQTAPATDATKYRTPITSVKSLDLYASRVAGTVAILVIQLVLYHHARHPELPKEKVRALLSAGHDMGLALQYTNIARDIRVDALNGRCYIPPEWLAEVGLKDGGAVVKAFSKFEDDESSAEKMMATLAPLQSYLLTRAFAFYNRSVPAVEQLPRAARAPMRVAVESYMQIARELRAREKARSGSGKVKTVDASRATVPLGRRVLVAWWAMMGPRRRGGLGSGEI